MAKIFNTPFAQDGDKVSPPDSVQADGSVSYPQGYGFDYQRDTSLDAEGDPVDPLAKVFPREQHNGILNDITTAIGEVQKNGFAVWQAEASPYPINAVVRYGDKTWRSQVASNTATPAENASWTETSGKFVGLGGTAPIQLRSGAGSTAGNIYARLGSSDLGYLWHSGNFDPNTKITGDACLYAGFEAASASLPYMRHAPTNQVIQLALRSELLALLPKLEFTTTDFIRIPDKPGGLIIQWGRTYYTDIVVTLDIPITFPRPVTQMFGVVVTVDTTQPGTVATCRNNTTTGTTIVVREPDTSVSGGSVFWVAIGN